jgi:hypothetical protein
VGSGREKGMKQAGILMVVLVFFIGTSVGAFAQQKAELKTTKQSAPVAAGLSEAFRMGGVIIDIDLARRKISLQQQKVKRGRTVTLNLDKRVVENAAAFGKGDAVNVWVKGNTVTEVEKIPNPVWEEISKKGK